MYERRGSPPSYFIALITVPALLFRLDLSSSAIERELTEKNEVGGRLNEEDLMLLLVHPAAFIARG